MKTVACNIDDGYGRVLKVFYLFVVRVFWLKNNPSYISFFHKYHTVYIALIFSSTRAIGYEDGAGLLKTDSIISSAPMPLSL